MHRARLKVSIDPKAVKKKHPARGVSIYTCWTPQTVKRYWQKRVTAHNARRTYIELHATNSIGILGKFQPLRQSLIRISLK
jgi:hypothetical protein